MAYSYSSISKFLQCNQAYYRQYVLKEVEFKQSEPARYGSEHHDFIDGVVRGTKEWSARYEFLKPTVDQLLAIPGELHTEYPICFMEDWTPTDWKNRESYVKGKLDAIVFHPTEPRVIIKDWKFSGKIEPQKYDIELDMFSWLVFKRHEDVEKINTGLVWLKTRGPESKKTYDRSQYAELEDSILGKIKRIEDALCFDRWPCSPSGLCYGHCSATKCPQWKPLKQKY